MLHGDPSPPNNPSYPTFLRTGDFYKGWERPQFFGDFIRDLETSKAFPIHLRHILGTFRVPFRHPQGKNGMSDPILTGITLLFGWIFLLFRMSFWHEKVVVYANFQW